MSPELRNGMEYEESWVPSSHCESQHCRPSRCCLGNCRAVSGSSGWTCLIM